MSLALFAARASAASSGPNWPTFLLGLLGTFLVGIATSSLIQLYVVPRVETRKRREDRWERWVLELGELLTGSVAERAADLHAAQLLYRETREYKEDFTPAQVDRAARESTQAMFAYGSILNPQVDWLVDRVVSISPDARGIVQLHAAWRNYQMQTVMVRVLPEDDTWTDEQFDEAWEKDRGRRNELIAQVKVLANLPHPPTRSRWRRRSKAQPR